MPTFTSNAVSTEYASVILCTSDLEEEAVLFWLMYTHVFRKNSLSTYARVNVIEPTKLSCCLEKDPHTKSLEMTCEGMHEMQAF